MQQFPAPHPSSVGFGVSGIACGPDGDLGMNLRAVEHKHGTAAAAPPRSSSAGTSPCITASPWPPTTRSSAGSASWWWSGRRQPIWGGLKKRTFSPELHLEYCAEHDHIVEAIARPRPRQRPPRHACTSTPRPANPARRRRLRRSSSRPPTGGGPRGSSESTGGCAPASSALNGSNSKCRGRPSRRGCHGTTGGRTAPMMGPRRPVPSNPALQITVFPTVSQTHFRFTRHSRIQPKGTYRKQDTPTYLTKSRACRKGLFIFVANSGSESDR